MTQKAGREGKGGVRTNAFWGGTSIIVITVACLLVKTQGYLLANCMLTSQDVLDCRAEAKKQPQGCYWSLDCGKAKLWIVTLNLLIAEPSSQKFEKWVAALVGRHAAAAASFSPAHHFWLAEEFQVCPIIFIFFSLSHRWYYNINDGTGNQNGGKGPGINRWKWNRPEHLRKQWAKSRCL